MAWAKSSRGLVDLFTQSLPRDGSVAVRKMFGFPAAFVHGNMFAGLFEEQMFVRLAPRRRETLDAEFGAVAFEPMPGRPMKAYTLVPEDLMADDEPLAALLADAFAHAAGLPAKEKKTKPAKT